MILTVKTTGKSRGKSATTQRNEYCFFCHVISRAFVRWRSVSDGNPKTVTRRPEEMPSVPQKPNPQGIAFIIGRTQACNLEIHCTVAPARDALLEQLLC